MTDFKLEPVIDAETGTITRVVYPQEAPARAYYLDELIKSMNDGLPAEEGTDRAIERTVQLFGKAACGHLNGAGCGC